MHNSRYAHPPGQSLFPLVTKTLQCDRPQDDGPGLASPRKLQSLSPFLFRNKCTSLVQSDLQTTHISDSAASPGASPPTLLSVLFNSFSFVNLNTHVLIGAQFMSQ